VAATQHYAARWAAKEAVLRSLGFRRSGGVRWTDIEIVFDESQRFRAELDGEIFRQAEAREIDEILISLAHCRSYATATAIAQTL
jgi:holo-[acyl-carrier protein] synthase